MVVFGGKTKSWQNPKVQLPTTLEGLRVEWIILDRNGVLTIFSSSMKSLDFCEFSHVIS